MTRVNRKIIGVTPSLAGVHDGVCSLRTSLFVGHVENLRVYGRLTVDVDDIRMGVAMCSDVGKVLIFPRHSPDEHRVVSKKAGAINPIHIIGKGLVGAASPNLNIRLT